MIAIAVRPMAMPIRARRRSVLGIACASADRGCSSSMAQTPAMIMNTPRPVASIRYSGQWRRKASDASLISAPGGEFRVKGHAAIDEQRDPVDVITVVRGKPDSRSGNIFGLANAFVRDETHQCVIRFRCRPRSHIDRRARRPGREPID